MGRMTSQIRHGKKKHVGSHQPDYVPHISTPNHDSPIINRTMRNPYYEISAVPRPQAEANSTKFTGRKLSPQDPKAS